MGDNGAKSVIDLNARDGTSVLAFCVFGYGKVCGITNDPEAYAAAAIQQASPNMHRRRIIVGADLNAVSMLAGRKFFDLVLLDDAFEGMSERNRHSQMQQAMGRTASHGLNIVCAPVNTVEVRNEGRSSSNHVSTLELERAYMYAGWNIQSQGILQPTQPENNDLMPIPLSYVIAEKP